MSRQHISQHYARLAARWPHDRLRPDVQFQQLLHHRITAAPVPQETQQNVAQALPYNAAKHHARAERQEVNAAYLLLDGAFQKQYPLSPAMMQPKSNPQYYELLGRELAEAPDRTWFANLKKRLRNLIRFK